MFALLGIIVDTRVGVLDTGIAIGTGCSPVHLLVGILEQGKATLEGLEKSLRLNLAEKTQQQVAV